MAQLEGVSWSLGAKVQAEGSSGWAVESQASTAWLDKWTSRQTLESWERREEKPGTRLSFGALSRDKSKLSGLSCRPGSEKVQEDQGQSGPLRIRGLGVKGTLKQLVRFLQGGK